MMYVVPGSGKWWPCGHPSPDDYGPEGRALKEHALHCPAFALAHPGWNREATIQPDDEFVLHLLPVLKDMQRRRDRLNEAIAKVERLLQEWGKPEQLSADASA